MIIDITGIELIPGNNGKDCPGNGNWFDENGNRTECCCDECDYLLCCLKTHTEKDCVECTDCDCPRRENNFFHKNT